MLEEIPEDRNLRKQWNELVLRQKRPQVFYTYEWALAVYRSYSKTLRPLLFLAYNENETLAGIAALALELMNDQVCFLCATTADYCDFLASEDSSAPFVSAVLLELKERNLTRITLTNLPADASTFAALRKSSVSNGYHVYARTAYHCAQIVLSQLERLPGGEVSLPRARAIRRSLKAMGRDATVELTHLRSWSETEPVLPRFVQAHVARFLATGRISNLAHRERQTFLAELAKLLAERGWLALSRLGSRETSFAWNYGFQFEGTWFWYQPTFDNQYEKLSPGLCLLAKIIEAAAANPGLTTVDLGLGAEGYKEVFSNETQETMYVTLRRSRLQHAAEMVRYRLASRVKSSPKTEATIRAGLANLRALRTNVSSIGLPAVLRRLGSRLAGLVYSKTKVIFFESSGLTCGRNSAGLLPLDLNLLAVAACQHVGDQFTCSYLMRSAKRLQEGGADGFAVTDGKGDFVHFAWATQFDGFFLSELNAKVNAPSSDSVMIFDCWTPPSFRGRGYYAEALGQLACLMRRAGKTAWIFSAAKNTASIRGLEKAGFERRYSMTRRLICGRQTINGPTAVVGQPSRDAIPIGH